MKKQFLTLVLSVLIGAVAVAQDLLNINDFVFKKEHFNTAYISKDSGSLDISTVVATANAVEESNKFHFLVYGTLGKTGLGIGAKVNTSFYKIFQSTTAEFLLAKRVAVGKKNFLNFGINGGVVLNSLKMDRINQYTDINDPVLVDGNFQKVGFTAGMAMNYNWNNRIDFGISLPVFVQSNEGVAPVFFTNLSYRHPFGDKVALQPGLMVYGPDYTTPSIEGNLVLHYQEFFYAKVAGRSTKSLLFGAGGSINFVEIGYVYQMQLDNSFSLANMAQHNIHVAFHFMANNPFQKKNEEAALAP